MRVHAHASSIAAIRHRRGPFSARPTLCAENPRPVSRNSSIGVWSGPAPRAGTTLFRRARRAATGVRVAVVLSWLLVGVVVAGALALLLLATTVVPV